MPKKTRKTPKRHRVRGHTRNGKKVTPFVRGSGSDKRNRKILVGIENRLDDNLKIQAQDAIAELYTDLGGAAMAKEIKAGRNVVGNVEFGIKILVHNKVGPRYDPTTKKFTPMSAKGRQLEDDFVKNMNGLLENGGFKKINPNLIPNLRKRDIDFEKEVKMRG